LTGFIYRQLHQALGRLMVVILQTIFVTNHLAVQLVDQFVDCGVQISVSTLSKNIGPFDMDVAFRSLPAYFFFLFFHRKQDFDIHDLVEMADDSIKFACDVTAQGWSDLKVMAADRQIHK
jgi:hypothetical protein